MKANKEEEEKPLRFLRLIEKPVPRPPTPQIHVPDLVRKLIQYCIFLFL